MATPAATFVIHIDNMSYRSNEQDVVDFLGIDPASVLNVKLVKNDKGQSNGDCYVEISNQIDAEKALSLNGQKFCERKAMLTKSSPEAMNSDKVPIKVRGGKWDGTVRLYGFTYDSTVDTVLEYCHDLDVLPGRILLEKDPQGRHNGNAYVQFSTFTHATDAVNRNKSTVKSIDRYIDSEPSSNSSYRKALLSNKKIEANLGQAGGPGAAYGNAGPYNNGATTQTGPMATVQMGGLNLDGQGKPQGSPASSQPSNGFASFDPRAPAGAYGATNGYGAYSNQSGYQQQSVRAGGPMASSLSQHNRPAPYQYGAGANQYGYEAQAPNQHNQQPAQPQLTANPAAAMVHPAAPTNAKSAAPASDCPFPHVIGGLGFPAGVTNPNIQEFFRPFRAIAVKLENDGSGDIAFKTHADCVGAMAKSSQLLLGVPIHLVLKSKPPSEQAIQRGAGWTTSN